MADSAPPAVIDAAADTTIAPIPIADLPPSTAPSNPPKRQPLPLTTLLGALPSNIDAFLTRLNKCLSTPSGIDTVMLFLCYSSKLSSSILSHLSQSALRRSARDWLALIATLPRGTTVVFSGEGAATAPPPAAVAALALSKRLTSLSGLLSEARMILRLWALLPMYFWAKRLAGQIRARVSSSASAEEKNAGPTKTELAIDFLRLALCVVFQGLENAAYLSSRGVLTLPPAKQGLAYKWSARFWAAFVGIELGRLATERVAGGTFAAKTAAEKNDWARRAVRQLAWAPLTLHWGSDKGLLGEMTVGALASVPGVIQLSGLWASTA
ncbi:hypothetical protein C8A05DRAFT_19670 [Staphylotrichum tortipilum]|uniref:Peroxin 11C n=1 Tax=Staphylotrichum tortipilum TaxID=2831512 RepID=A0AAN6MBU8_9PEZI|nr:hypothetical protein C8A05DRAFT_19670 [Staphylotrichum longicolle]